MSMIQPGNRGRRSSQTPVDSLKHGLAVFISFLFVFLFFYYLIQGSIGEVMKEGEKGGGRNKMHDSFLSLLALYMLGLFAPP